MLPSVQSRTSCLAALAIDQLSERELVKISALQKPP